MKIDDLIRWINTNRQSLGMLEEKYEIEIIVVKLQNILRSSHQQHRAARGGGGGGSEQVGPPDVALSRLYSQLNSSFATSSQPASLKKFFNHFNATVIHYRALRADNLRRIPVSVIMAKLGITSVASIQCNDADITRALGQAISGKLEGISDSLTRWEIGTDDPTKMFLIALTYVALNACYKLPKSLVGKRQNIKALQAKLASEPRSVGILRKVDKSKIDLNRLKKLKIWDHLKKNTDFKKACFLHTCTTIQDIMMQDVEQDPPEFIVGPISREIMETPVRNTAGFVYDLVQIQKWYEQSETDPMSRASVTSTLLTAMPNISRCIERYHLLKECYKNYQLAIQSYRQKKYKDALKNFIKQDDMGSGLQLYSGTPLVKYNIARCYMHLKNYKLAIHLLQPLPQTGSNKTAFFECQGHIQLANGESQEALQNFQNALQFLPKNKPNQKKNLQQLIASCKKSVSQSSPS